MLCAATFGEHCGWLVWLGLLPYAYALRPTTPALAAYGGVFLGAAVYHMLGLSWMCMCVEGAFTPGWFFATLAGAICCPPVFFLGRRLVRNTGWPCSIALPLTWVAYEYLRHQVLVIADCDGFPLLWLGVALAGDEHLVQIADLGGVLALTWLAASVNGAVFDVLAGVAGQRACRRRTSMIISAAIGVCSVLGAVFYGHWRLGQPLDSVGPRIALVTGKPSGELRLEGAVVAKTTPSARGMASTVSDKPSVASTIDAYVWPEAALGRIICMEPESNQGLPIPTAGREERKLHSVAEKLNAPLLVGACRLERSTQTTMPRLCNSIVYVGSKQGMLGVYDKWHLVPFLEYTPAWMDWLGWPNAETCGFVVAGKRAFRRGRSAVPFLLEANADEPCFRIGVTVCYDVCYPDVHRRYMSTGKASAPHVFCDGPGLADSGRGRFYAAMAGAFSASYWLGER